jgi:hypothetical protein
MTTPAWTRFADRFPKAGDLPLWLTDDTGHGSMFITGRLPTEWDTFIQIGFTAWQHASPPAVPPPLPRPLPPALPLVRQGQVSHSV